MFHLLLIFVFFVSSFNFVPRVVCTFYTTLFSAPVCILVVIHLFIVCYPTPLKYMMFLMWLTIWEDNWTYPHSYGTESNRDSLHKWFFVHICIHYAIKKICGDSCPIRLLSATGKSLKTSTLFSIFNQFDSDKVQSNQRLWRPLLFVLKLFPGNKVVNCETNWGRVTFNVELGWVTSHFSSYSSW